MAIETSRDPVRNFTTLAIVGPVTLDEMIKVVDDFYAEESTRYTLWDLSQSDLSNVKPDEILKFIQKAAESGLVHERDGRTAIFASDDLQYGLGRMAETYADCEDFPYGMGLFRSREEAMDWLLSD